MTDDECGACRSQPQLATICNPTTTTPPPTHHPNTRQFQFQIHIPSRLPPICNTGFPHILSHPTLTPVDNVGHHRPKMSSSSTTSYIHPGGVLRPTHQRTTSRCEKVLRDLLAKEAHRHPGRPFVSTERTRQNTDSVKHWLAHTDSSIDSQLVFSSPSSLARSNSLSSKPTYLTTQLPPSIKSVIPSI